MAVLDRVVAQAVPHCVTARGLGRHERTGRPSGEYGLLARLEANLRKSVPQRKEIQKALKVSPKSSMLSPGFA
jgi:hypothetical protein